MKKESEMPPTAQVQSPPVIWADCLKVQYSVVVTTGTGHNAFKVDGGFDLPAALHPAMRFHVQDDFDALLTRSVLNTAKVLISMLMDAVAAADAKGDSLWKTVEQAIETPVVPPPVVPVPPVSPVPPALCPNNLNVPSVAAASAPAGGS